MTAEPDQIEPILRLHRSILDIAATDWDACALRNGAGDRPHDPFTTHRFLAALETSGSVGDGTGWLPHHLALYQGGQLMACAPCYLKTHSQGEYIFDHHWAEALHRAGAAYYPKLQIAVPFTPVSGRRILVRENADPQWQALIAKTLLAAACELTRGNELSSLHVTFCTEAEALLGPQVGLMPRASTQYHWHNPGFADFDAYLGALNARKRKNIKRDRAIANAFGGDIIALTGDAITPSHWDAFWTFYQDTGARKWGKPYLTRAFFDAIHDTMRDDILLVLAVKDGQPIAGALNFIGADAIFGRYWGMSEHHDCLHFELCYYRAIDYAITHGLARVEAGAQGEHKLARGYLASPTHSLHFASNPSFHNALSDYLIDETDAIIDEREMLNAHSPFARPNDKPS